VPTAVRGAKFTWNRVNPKMLFGLSGSVGVGIGTTETTGTGPPETLFGVVSRKKTWTAAGVKVLASTGRSNVTWKARADGVAAPGSWGLTGSPGRPIAPIVLSMTRGPAANVAVVVRMSSRSRRVMSLTLFSLLDQIGWILPP